MGFFRFAGAKGGSDLSGNATGSSAGIRLQSWFPGAYDGAMRQNPEHVFSLDMSGLRPGMRLAVGVSGGADSVALLRALVERGKEAGLVISAAHLHHGLRGEEADGDQAFVSDLAAKLGVGFRTKRVDVARAAEANPAIGKSGESIEEAARRLRYSWFRDLMANGEVDAVATAHTLDDQAETVLLKFLRGAWTEGLSGIHPVVAYQEGRIVRPMLGISRAEIEAWLKNLGQSWREDSSNQEREFARNRVRHDLLPLLESWNPRLREHLAQMADLAREEENFWKGQLAWLAPQLILPGDPVRGGGRAGGEGLALEVSQLASQPTALQRRVLRHAVEQLGTGLDFPSTEALRELAIQGRAGQKRELANGVHAERSHREVRLRRGSAPAVIRPESVTAAVPGELQGFGVQLRVERLRGPGEADKAVLRCWQPGDRVRQRYTSGPKKIKEVLERMKVSGEERALWPVLEVAGKILWMKDVELEPEGDCAVTVLSGGRNGRLA